MTAHNHFILKCHLCSKVISQCRCMDKNKETRMTVCAACKEIIQKANEEIKEALK